MVTKWQNGLNGKVGDGIVGQGSVYRGKQWAYNAKLLVLFASCRLAIMTYYMAGKFGYMYVESMYMLYKYKGYGLYSGTPL